MKKNIINIVMLIIIMPSLIYCEEEINFEIKLEGFMLNDIAHDGDYVWCSTDGNGVMCYNKKDCSYIQYTKENGLPSDIMLNNWVRCVAIDKKGLKWIGLRSGIASFDDTTWTAYRSVDTGIILWTV